MAFYYEGLITCLVFRTHTKMEEENKLYTKSTDVLCAMCKHAHNNCFIFFSHHYVTFRISFYFCGFL